MLEKSFVLPIPVFVLNSAVRGSWLLQVIEVEEVSGELTLSSSSLLSS